MAVSSSKSALSLGQRLWNSLSAWAIRNAGYQKYGKYVCSAFSLTITVAQSAAPVVYIHLFSSL